MVIIPAIFALPVHMRVVIVIRIREYCVASSRVLAVGRVYYEVLVLVDDGKPDEVSRAVRDLAVLLRCTLMRRVRAAHIEMADRILFYTFGRI